MPEDEKNNDLIRHRGIVKARVDQLREFAGTSTYGPVDLCVVYTSAEKDYQAAEAYLKTLAPTTNEADEFDGLPRALEWPVNTALTADVIQSRFDDLPENARVIDPMTKTFNSSGEYTVNVTLEFADKSKKTVELVVSVKDKLEDHSGLRIKPIEELRALDKDKKYADGTYQGYARGYLKNIYVTVTVEGGKITSITNAKPGIKVDDGGEFEESGFNHIIDTIITHQDPQNLAAQLNMKLDLVQGIYDFAAKENHSNEVYQKAMQHFFGDAAGAPRGLNNSNLGQVQIYDAIGRTVLSKLKAAQYDRVTAATRPDVKTSATWTARGTANAVVDALQKAKADNDVLSVNVQSDRIKFNQYSSKYTASGYVRGEQFDFSDYKVVLEKRGNKTEVITSEQFVDKGIEVVNVKTQAVVKDGMILSDENVGGKVSNGLTVQFVHRPSGAKFELSVSILQNESLKLQSMEYRLKGNDAWKPLFTVPDDQWDEFIIKASMASDELNGITGKEIETRLTYSDKKGNTYQLEAVGDRAITVPSQKGADVNLELRGLTLDGKGKYVQIPYQTYRLSFIEG